MAGGHKKEARINFRPLLFCAAGLGFGVFLCGRIRFGGLSPSDFLFPGVFLLLALFPLSFKRTVALFLSVLAFAGAGALLFHLQAERFLTVLPEGEYRLSGTVEQVAEGNGYSYAVLGNLYCNGERQGGKCRLLLSDRGIRPADRIALTAHLEPTERERPYFASSLAEDIRYRATAGEYERTGVSANPFLRLNAAFYELLCVRLGGEEGAVAYALLTGNANGIDDGLYDLVRSGGVVHMFAVSGLHIGIVYGAVFLLCRKLRRFRALPASALALCYSALCGFSVSSLRAVVMCTALGATRVFGRKYDFLQSLSLAAIVVLLLSPAQWFAAGFRLSFAACLGLALFAGPLQRGLARLRVPAKAGGLLASVLSVHSLLFPVLMDCFGSFPFWGLVLNLVILPVFPFCFAAVLLFTAAALIFSADALLLVPKGILSALLYLFSVAEFRGAATGFAIGAGGGAFALLVFALTPRTRFRPAARSVLSLVFAALFCTVVVCGNVVFDGCRVDCGEGLALIRTRHESVLLLGDADLAACEEFLRTRQAGKLDAVLALAEDEERAINVAVFLDAETVCARDEIATGLARAVSFGECYEAGSLSFRFESRTKLLLDTEGLLVEIDFISAPAFGADLFLGRETKNLRYHLKDGAFALMQTAGAL